MVVLREGNNGFTCMPGNLNVVGEPPTCVDGAAMQWYEEWSQHRSANLSERGGCYENGPGGELPFYNDAMTTATSSPDMNVILAAGGVLCRHTPAGGDEVLVVHMKRYGDWTLPKGKLKPGESFAAAALRKVAEETGCRARFEDYLGAIGYAVNGVPKAVLFWRMSLIEQNEIADHEEVAEVLWMPVPAAIQRLTYPDERAFALRASEGVRNV
jgi:8-oxo-dGTP pyrophosphatase MutT (NUDIX family)